MALDEAQYATLVDAVDAASALCRDLETCAPSPKRDAALEILRRELADAILRLAQAGSRLEFRT